MDWSPFYPALKDSPEERRVEFLDVGCGYGGLLSKRPPSSSYACFLWKHLSLVLVVALSPLFPETLMLGIEIRIKLVDYVTERVQALRNQNPGHYTNVACLRTNAMKYIPNYFRKHQVRV